MFSNNARLVVISVFMLMGSFFIYQHSYQLAGIAFMFSGYLTWGYFKEGPIVLAAKYFHNKDYDKAEALLNQIKKPAWLSKSRRGFYEFLMGGISLQKQDFDAAEMHYEIAAQYPLRNVNDHVAALVHVANISIRQGNYDKAGAYLELANKHGEKITAKMKDVINRLHQELKKH
jgi:tetratricopeptide (TPR) repeat protein